MKTIFDNRTFVVRSPWMGAATLPPTVDKATRDQILLTLAPAIGKTKEINDLLAWSHEHDPYLKNFFGNDQGSFWLAWNSVYEARPVIDGLMARMMKDDPSAWTDLSDDEAGFLDTWPQAVDGVYQIYEEHYKALPPSQKPGAAPPAPLATAKKSVLSENILIGGAIVVGLGVLVYAIT